MPDDVARITDMGPIPCGVEYALHCPPCEVDWVRSSGMTCWVCARLGHLGVLHRGAVLVPDKVFRAEQRAVEAACNTYEPVPRPRSA